jgi:hypothetical protein
MLLVGLIVGGVGVVITACGSVLCKAGTACGYNGFRLMVWDDPDQIGKLEAFVQEQEARAEMRRKGLDV